MDCREFELAWVGDDEHERRRAADHAAVCPGCAETVRADRALLDAVAQWKESAPGPSEIRGHRIAAALVEKGWIDGEPALSRSGPQRRRAVAAGIWVAAAAVILLGVTILLQRPGTETEEGSMAEAVRQVERAQQDYARAIAGLERRADEVLARAEDPELDMNDAALLLNYRDRLTHLDSVIDEVQAFLDEHPGHARGHTVLLAAYEEKDQLLREILELSPGESS
jgi:hypothetical protein